MRRGESDETGGCETVDAEESWGSSSRAGVRGDVAV